MRLLALLLLAFTLHAAEPAKPAESQEIKDIRSLVSEFNHRFDLAVEQKSNVSVEPKPEMSTALMDYYLHLLPTLDLKDVDQAKIQKAHDELRGGYYHDSIKNICDAKSGYDNAKNDAEKLRAKRNIADVLSNGHFCEWQLKLKGQRIISLPEWGIRGGFTY